jgi:hypothetical protein
MQFPTLNSIVLDTLHLFQSQAGLKKIDFTKFHTPLVVWSGNGYYTGRIIFRNSPAYFAVESEVLSKLENIPSITDVVVVSASGEKHAPILLESAKKRGKKTFLISSSEKSSGREIADESIIMPKVREPYTYNTSTYFGYMLAEQPDIDLHAFEAFLLWKFEALLSEIPFGKYKSFFIVLPNQFVLLREMVEVKFIELFGRKIARDVFSYEQMKHATTVVADDNELFLCFDNKAELKYWKNQMNLPIFDESSYALMMLTVYYLVGKIQGSFPPYFMDSIEKYCEEAKVKSGFNIKPWVEV